MNLKATAKHDAQTKSVTPKYTAEQLLQRVEEYVDSFQYDLAAKFCERALQVEPDNLKALELSGFLSLQSGDTEHAKLVSFGYKLFVYDRTVLYGLLHCTN